MKPILRSLPGLLIAGMLCVTMPFASAARTPAPRGHGETVSVPTAALDDARRAQTLLGPTTWSRLIRISNLAARSVYPAVVYALVFEEAGILWFYTDTDGTQSFSLHPDRLAEEKADFAPLLRAIEPGFGAFELLASDRARDSRPVSDNHGSGDPCSSQDEALPNGCFIESFAALRESVARGVPIERARLLSCYVDTPGGRRGHTVLTYETPRGLFLLDPARSPEPRLVPREWADDAVALAAVALEGAKVARARWVPTELPSPISVVASLDQSNDPVPGAAPRLMR